MLFHMFIQEVLIPRYPIPSQSFSTVLGGRHGSFLTAFAWRARVEKFLTTHYRGVLGIF